MTLPDALLDSLRAARRYCVVTGAGVSAESGVPTFRDAQTGLWAKFDPMALATLEAFLADPELVWRWYRWRRDLVAKSEPNPGHVALATLEQRVPAFDLITQNVDGLHARAGSRNITEFHGNLFDDLCISGCPSQEADDAPAPRCSNCGDLLRPGVVWFGEAISDSALETAFGAATDCDVLLSAGTSAQVYPAAGLAALAHRSGAVTVEINTEPTGGEEFDFVLEGPAGLILPELVASLDC